MLKTGFAWHYTAYDKRPEFAQVSNCTDIPSIFNDDINTSIFFFLITFLVGKISQTCS